MSMWIKSLFVITYSWIKHMSFLVSRLKIAYWHEFTTASWQRITLNVLSYPIRPLGSVLGPVLFSVYISPISYLIATHNLQHQQYADDTQLYIAVSPTDSASSVEDGSNPVSQIFTVGFHTTAFVWIQRNRMLFCLVLSKGSAHFHTLHPSKSRALLYISLI